MAKSCRVKSYSIPPLDTLVIRKIQPLRSLSHQGATDKAWYVHIPCHKTLFLVSDTQMGGKALVRPATAIHRVPNILTMTSVCKQRIKIVWERRWMINSFFIRCKSKSILRIACRTTLAFWILVSNSRGFLLKLGGERQKQTFITSTVLCARQKLKHYSSRVVHRLVFQCHTFNFKMLLCIKLGVQASFVCGMMHKRTLNTQSCINNRYM